MKTRLVRGAIDGHFSVILHDAKLNNQAFLQHGGYRMSGWSSGISYR